MGIRGWRRRAAVDAGETRAFVVVGEGVAAGAAAVEEIFSVGRIPLGKLGIARGAGRKRLRGGCGVRPGDEGGDLGGREARIAMDEEILRRRHVAGAGLLCDLSEEDLLLVGRGLIPLGEIEMAAGF